MHVCKYKTIYTLNLFDCAVTLWLVYMFGADIEDNVFGLMLLQSPALTVVFKTVVIGMAVLMLYRYRHRPMVKSITQRCSYYIFYWRYIICI